MHYNLAAPNQSFSYGNTVLSKAKSLSFKALSSQMETPLEGIKELRRAAPQVHFLAFWEPPKYDYLVRNPNCRLQLHVD